jgi:hypothetical protein
MNRELYIKELFDNAKSEKERHLKNIKHIIEKSDRVMLLSYILYNWFYANQDNIKIDSHKELPLIHFITGLCLNDKEENFNLLLSPDAIKLSDELISYFDCFTVELMFVVNKNDIQPKEQSRFLSQSFKLLNSVNSGAYQFQLDEFSKKIFQPLESYFLENHGFSIDDIFIFSNAILNYYINKVNNFITIYNKKYEEAKKIIDSKDDESGFHEYCRINNIIPEKRLEQYSNYLKLLNMKNIFTFKIDDFFYDNQILQNKFKKYIESFSCKFGDNNNFNSPLNKNIIFQKPIIKIDNNNYFCPIPFLLTDHNVLFQSLIEDDIKNNIDSNLNDKFNELKSTYLEETIVEYLLRLFPANSIFKNLKFSFNGKLHESDVLVHYDNKVIIFEAKSGSFTEPAMRGAPDRLKKDLGKLLKDSYNQGQTVREYIQSTTNAKFLDKKSGKIIHEIKNYSKDIEFFIVSLTLVPLRGLATNLKDLEDQNLFSKEDYPWYLCIFDLDIITKFIFNPSIFIHYIQQRLEAQKEYLIHGINELEFLGWYLKYGNFTIIKQKQKDFSNIFLVNTFTEIFDNHYLLQKPAPKNELENEFIDVIKSLEFSKIKNHTKAISALLNLLKEHRCLIFKQIKEKISLTSKDFKHHNFSIAFIEEPFSFGLTFISEALNITDKGKMMEIGTIYKYKHKVKKWLVLRKKIYDSEYFINDLLYIESNWVYDDNMEKIKNIY